jgi:hypothetical protein
MRSSLLLIWTVKARRYRSWFGISFFFAVDRFLRLERLLPPDDEPAVVWGLERGVGSTNGGLVTSEDDWVVDGVCGVDAVVDSNCWGAEDANGLDGFGVSSGVGG